MGLNRPSMFVLRLGCWLGMAVLACALPVTQAATVSFPRHKPCNLFEVGASVAFEPTVSTERGGDLAIDIAVTRDDGRIVFEKKQVLTLKPRARQPFGIDLGKLEPGYYEMAVNLGDGTRHLVNFGVVRFIDRSAAQALQRGSRFGMKLWMSGDIWWDRRLTWDAGEAMQVCCAMGLQWTRAGLSDKSMGSVELATRYPLNIISKVETFPPDCFDEARFGPLEAYRKTDKGRSWNKSTLPREQPYKAWLKEQIAAVPAQQNVFEIWNEPWQWSSTMPAEDFAKLCNWAVEVIKELRPNAIVGPNIHGELTAYDLAVIDAGGLQRMDMVAIHPYTAGTPEDKGFRQKIRNYRDGLRAKLGRDLDLYTTEYGWSTAPQGQRVVSESEQARLTVRESLMLYAENVKTLIPHTLGQRQQNPEEREDYFGFFRMGNQPKPAIVAFATCARLIDGSRFVGDLWLAPGIGAMLFERDEQLTLALWTESEPGEITFDPGVPNLTAVHLMGRSANLPVPAGGLKLKIGPDVTYLVGVGRQIAQLATPPDGALNPDLWTTRAGQHEIFRLQKAPTIDGQLDDWIDVPLSRLSHPKVNDHSAAWRLAWDAQALYLAVDVADHALVNASVPGPVLAMGDAVVLQLGTRPDRQAGKPDLYDFEIIIAPTSSTGQPAFALKNLLMKTVINPAADDASGIRWSVTQDKKRWVAEAAIPFGVLGAARPKTGQKMAFSLTVFDRDRADQDEWKQFWKRLETFDKKGKTNQMPYLVFGENRP